MEAKVTFQERDRVLVTLSSPITVSGCKSSYSYATVRQPEKNGMVLLEFDGIHSRRWVKADKIKLVHRHTPKVYIHQGWMPTQQSAD